MEVLDNIHDGEFNVTECKYLVLEFIIGYLVALILLAVLIKRVKNLLIVAVLLLLRVVQALKGDLLPEVEEDFSKLDI